MEKLHSYSDLNLNEFFVCNLYETMNSRGTEKIIQKNKVFLTRLSNLTKISLSYKHDIVFKKFSSNICGNNLERLIVKKLELIDDDEAIVKTTNRQNIDKIMIINWKMAKTIGTIGTKDTQKQVCCWIKHLNQIVCYQKDKSKLIKESKCSLFSKTGNIIRSVYSIDNNIHEVNSIFYNNINLQIYLNVFNKLCFKTSIISLTEKFELISIIEENLFDTNFSLNFLSEIQFLNSRYIIFNYNANIAFLQLKDTNKNVYIFDKFSYSIVDSFQTDSRLIMVLGDKMLFRSRSCYLMKKVPVFSNPGKFRDFEVFCKLNPFKKVHLLLNPYLLPCGNSACLECIYQQYNLFKHTLTCVLCNQEHKLPKQLEPTNKLTISDFFTHNLIHSMIDENKKFISDLGILINFI